jgi:hypothetical protein
LKNKLIYGDCLEKMQLWIGMEEGEGFVCLKHWTSRNGNKGAQREREKL